MPAGFAGPVSKKKEGDVESFGDLVGEEFGPSHPRRRFEERKRKTSSYGTVKPREQKPPVGEIISVLPRARRKRRKGVN